MIGFICQKNSQKQYRFVSQADESVVATHWHSNYDECVEEINEIVPNSYEGAKKKYPFLCAFKAHWDNILPGECWQILHQQGLLEPIE